MDHEQSRCMGKLIIKKKSPNGFSLDSLPFVRQKAANSITEGNEFHPDSLNSKALNHKYIHKVSPARMLAGIAYGAWRELLPGRYRTWAPEKTDERGEAAGVSRPAYSPRAPSGRNPNRAPPRQRSIAPKLQPSHKHRTVSSSLSLIPTFSNQNQNHTKSEKITESQNKHTKTPKKGNFETTSITPLI